MKKLDKRKVVEMLIRERKLLGYSQMKLATEMGISLSTVSKVENGSVGISIDYLEGLSVVIGKELVVCFW